MTKENLGIVVKAFLFWGIFEFFVLGRGAIYPSFPDSSKWLLGFTTGGSIGLVMVFVTYLFLKSDRLTMADLGMVIGKGSFKRFVLGLAAGMALFGAFFLVYYWLTPVAFVAAENLGVFDAIVLSFLAFLMLGAMEEIVFRGYFLKKLERALGIRAAIYVTSIAFGLYHGLTFDSLTGPAVWGLLFGALLYWSKGLAVPIGVHVGVNLVQAIFGQKDMYAHGIWTAVVTETTTLFTVDQVTTCLQVLLLIAGVALIEVHLSRSRKAADENPVQA